MTTATRNSYLDSLLEGRPAVPEAAPALSWLSRLRAEAVDRVGVLTVPTTRDEDWRFTDITPLTKIPFHPARELPQLAVGALDGVLLPEAGARLTFVDGVFVPRLSFNNAGITVTNLAGAAVDEAAAIEAHLGRHAGFHGDVFAALNTAFLHDAAVVVVPRNAAVAAPVHLLFVATQPHAASYPRVLVVSGSGSSVTVVEDYLALVEEAYFTNAVSEVAIADNASVRHVRVQRDNEAAFHIGRCAVALGQASRYQSISVALGARISRHDLHVLQAAEGAECAIDGLALIGGSQLADSHTFIEHAQPHGASRQLHKCIVDGAAHAVFNGRIMVRPGAQRTDSSQSSRNLLLTGKARVDTKPQLEIFADDVKCAHGATVGQLEAEELFYLQSRGLSAAAARDLLTYAFGAEIIDRIPVATLKHRLEQIVLARTHRQQP